MKRRQVRERDLLDELDCRFFVGMLLEPGGTGCVQVFSDAVAFLQFRETLLRIQMVDIPLNTRFVSAVKRRNKTYA